MMRPTHDPDAPARLEVRHLRLVQAVALERSVTRAAARLHLSQSAVSHQLVDLERDLGVRLFDRIGKKMVPTAAGERLVRTATQVLGELALAEDELRSAGLHGPTKLRITTSCYTSYQWLPAALRHFASKHPRVELTVVLEATRRALDALTHDEVDLAITTESSKDGAHAVAPLCKSELVAVARRDHPLFEGDTVRWTALAPYPVLVHDITDQDVARLRFAVLGQSRRRTVADRELLVRKIPLTEAIVELVRGGHGVAVVDRWSVAGRLGREVRAVPFAPRASREFRAVWRKANPRQLPIEELLGLLRRHAERHANAEPPRARRAPKS